MKKHFIKDALEAIIEYEFDKDAEQITSIDYNHVQTLLREGYIEGELVHENSKGWWKLKYSG